MSLRIVPQDDDLKSIAQAAVAKYREAHPEVIITHHVSFNHPGPHKRHPQACCGSFVNPNEIVTPGQTPTCPGCASWLEAYEGMAF